MGPACCGSAHERGGPDNGVDANALQGQLTQLSEIGAKNTNNQNQNTPQKDAPSSLNLPATPKNGAGKLRGP